MRNLKKVQLVTYFLKEEQVMSFLEAHKKLLNIEKFNFGNFPVYADPFDLRSSSPDQS